MTNEELDDLPHDDTNTAPTAPKNDDAAQRIAAMERRLAIDDVRTTIGCDPTTAAEIHKIATESRLTPHEAAAVLMERKPETFGDSIAYGTATFGSLTPRAFGRQPKADDATRRKQYVDSLRGKNEALRNAYLDNQAGAHLAQAMGWEHKLLPIPD